MKEITVFSEGDSLDLNCWSNVPYLFTKTLEKKGIKVNRVNIYSNKYVRKTIWKYIFAPLLQLLYRGNIYEYDQTRLNRFFINLKIKRAIRRYKQSDLNLFLSYAYLNTDSKIPNVLFCDWTSEYVLLYRLNRKPLAIEKTYLQIQRSNIERADMVISLFPDIAKAMTEMYNREICYFNLNVINNVYERELNEEIILNRKKDSHILLFVGRKNYISGANLLIQVFSELKERYPLLELHIIGLSASDFKQLPQSVFCYDYLDKAKQNEKILYYELFLKAKIFINPTTLWGGYSSTVEAMFFYNPVIVSAYSSFVDSFGDEINFGYYVKNGQQDSLKACIIQIMDDPNYTRLCQNSHEAVKNFTWERYVDCFLERVEVLKKIMKKRLVVFHPALAPYRVDFFNSLNEAFDASFYFEFGNPLEQNFDQQKLQSRITFRPQFLKPGFGGVKNLRLDVLSILHREKPDIVCISEYNILGLLVVLYKFLTGSHFRIITICDDNIAMARSTKFVKRLTRAVLLRCLYAVVLADEKALHWYEQRWKDCCKWIYFPIIQSDEVFRSLLKKVLPLTDAFRRQYALDKKKVILYVGRLAEVKNVSLLLRAYQQVQKKEKDVALLVVGNGPLWDDLRKECVQLSIDDSVIFAGKQEGLDLMAHYNLGDLFVLPSRYEPFGTVVNEALLAGCYVLCSDIAGAACLIEEGVNGNLFDIEKEGDLVEKLLFRLPFLEEAVVVGIKKNNMNLNYDHQFNLLLDGING